MKVYGIHTVQFHEFVDMNFSDSRFREFCAKIPDFRIEHAKKCKHKKDRERSLAASYLLSLCMKEEGISLCEMPSYSERGKLYFEKYPEFHVNISHAGDYAVIALHDKEIGIDLEKVRPYKENIAKRVFTKEEQNALQCMENRWKENHNSVCEQELNEMFTRLWTRYESGVKLSGNGIAELVERDQTKNEKTITCFREIALKNGYFLTISCNSPISKEIPVYFADFEM